jgi:hypothetical protein
MPISQSSSKTRVGAQDADWSPARLIPTAGIRGQAEQESRATSALLAVLSAVPSFAQRFLQIMEAPGGRVRTFTEVRLKGPDGKTHIPDGAIVVERGARRWSCLLEVKTATARLEMDQVHRYLDMARRHEFDGVLTLSNDIVAEPDALPFKLNGQKVGKLKVRHISWWQVLTEAIIQHRFRGVDDPDQAWILGELIRYLTDERSGAAGFEGMGPEWVRLRDGARNGTLRSSDPEASAVAARWEQLVEFLCLNLSQELGVVVRRVRSRGKSPRARLEEAVAILSSEGRLRGAIRVPDAVGPIELEADLRSRRLITSVDIEAPRDRKRSTARINWLLGQLKGAPDELRIDVRFPRRREGQSALLGESRDAPERLLLPSDPKCPPSSFLIAQSRAIGTKGGRGEGSFVDETCKQAIRFYRELVQGLRAPQPKAPQLSEEIPTPAPEEREREQSERAARREHDQSLRNIAEMSTQFSD